MLEMFSCRLYAVAGVFHGLLKLLQGKEGASSLALGLVFLAGLWPEAPMVRDDYGFRKVRVSRSSDGSASTRSMRRVVTSSMIGRLSGLSW